MANKVIKYELVVCIVNTGFSDLVMDAAKKAGARGGTVIHAKGTASKDAESAFSIFIQPEKDLVLIIVPTDIKDAVLHNIYQDAGLSSPGQGIAFTMPVHKTAGLVTEIPVKVEEENK